MSMVDESEFGVGDAVIYPQHGAGRIVETEKRTFGNEEDGFEDVIYLVIDLELDDMRVRVPIHKADEVGLRKPVPAAEIEDLFELLGDHDVRIPQNFSRRFKNNQRRLNEGDVWQLAEVVRNLAIRLHKRHLSPSETTMYEHARGLLIAELALSLDVDPEKAEEKLDGVLPDPDPDEKD